MKNQDIFKAVGNISDELIDEAARPAAKCVRRGIFAGAAALAACAALAFAVW